MTRYRDGFEPVSNLFAFWSYGSFPFVLGGPVVAMNADGRVLLATYGGRIVRPCHLTTKKAGAAMLAELEKLCAEHDKAEKTFRNEWRAKVAELLPFVGTM